MSEAGGGLSTRHGESNTVLLEPAEQRMGDEEVQVGRERAALPDTRMEVHHPGQQEAIDCRHSQPPCMYRGWRCADGTSRPTVHNVTTLRSDLLGGS